MCGRFGFEMPPKRAMEHFGLERVEEYAPRRNIAPGQPVAVITPDRDGLVLLSMLWGLVPSWAKDPTVGRRMINARAETVSDKPSFRAAFRRRRCLVPADRFYEWQKTAEGKHPYAVDVDLGRVFAMAGLWEYWQGGDGSELFTVCIVTTRANSLVAPIHDRMPVILEEQHYAAWLDKNAAPAQLQHLLEPYPADAMRARPVSTLVNNPRNQDFPLEPQ